MSCQGSQRLAWLRLVPEPEQVLPRPVASLRTGAADPAESAINAEGRAIEQVVLHGSATSWLRYLSDVARLVRDPVVPELRPAALTCAEVVRDHHRLLMGLSPWLSMRTRRERLELERRVLQLRDELDVT
jgi:hypothetical protein